MKVTIFEITNFLKTTIIISIKNGKVKIKTRKRTTYFGEVRSSVIISPFRYYRSIFLVSASLYV